MKSLLKIYLLLLIGLYDIPCHGQYQNLSFNRLSIQEGLPEAVISCLIQDKLGYIWMGTQAGLVRYDGYEIKVYNFGQEIPLNANIGTLMEDKDGKLWVGTRSIGLFYYDRAQDIFKPFKPYKGDSISSKDIFSIKAPGAAVFADIDWNQRISSDIIL